MPLFHVCPKSACCSCIYRGWPVQSAVRFLLFSGFPFFYGLSHLGAGPCLMVGFAFLQPTPFFCYHLLPCHSIILAAKLFASILLGSFITLLADFCVPFVFSWASLVHLFSLGFLGPFLNFAFTWVFIEFFGLSRLNCIILYP